VLYIQVHRGYRHNPISKRLIYFGSSESASLNIEHYLTDNPNIKNDARIITLKDLASYSYERLNLTAQYDAKYLNAHNELCRLFDRKSDLFWMIVNYISKEQHEKSDLMQAWFDLFKSDLIDSERLINELSGIIKK
jgi:hypothetical protein